MNFDEETLEKKPVGSKAGTPDDVLPALDPTGLTTRFAEETVEKTLRLWAGITFSGVPVQTQRVWRGFGDDNTIR
jgi:hypothetical protein